MKRYTGFTLAEVLITLGIIGVVAAMTLPSLVGKYKEKQHISQVKKAYSVLSQAFLMAKNEYGSPENWGLKDSNTGETDDEGNPVYDYANSSVIVRNIFAKYIKNTGSRPHTFRKYVSLDGKNYNSSSGTPIIGTTNSDSLLYLADGTILFFGWMNEGCDSIQTSCGDIYVFLPERDAQLGVSEFNFYLSPEGVKPYGHQNHHYTFKDYCDITNASGKNSTQQGRGCTAWVLVNENMDYLHCTGLDWDKKTSYR